MQKVKAAKAKAKADEQAKALESKEEFRSEPKEMKLPLLNGFSNGSTLGDVRQRVAGAVASQ